MSELAELERRVTAALDRIGAAIGAAPAGDTAELQAALDAEKTANAQLEARIETLNDRVAAVEALKSQLADTEAALLRRDEELQTLRQVAAELRASNAALREANAAGLADASLVNAALMSENAALKSALDGGQGDIDEALALLEPLIEGGRDA